jgi:cell division septum initiation protein DivIVA
LGDLEVPVIPHRETPPQVSLRRTLDDMTAMVERASGVPLSASCVVNRAELLALIERARSTGPVPGAGAPVPGVDAPAPGGSDAEPGEAVARARERAGKILDAAREEAARLLRDADDYCDRRLAAFEDDLGRALAQVRRGRDRLRERSGAGAGPYDREAEAPQVVDVAAAERHEVSGLSRTAGV